jgi:hypothetical protein
MAILRSQEVLIRLIRLVEYLRVHRRGRFVRKIREDLEYRRATFYRDLGVLEAAGLPIHREIVDGEARIAFLDSDETSPNQRPIPVRSSARSTNRAWPRTADAGHVQAVLKEAVESGQEVHLVYSAMGVPAPMNRTLAPMRFGPGDSPAWLLTFDVARSTWPIIDIASIHSVRRGAFQDGASTPDIERAFRSACDAQQGGPVQVVATLAAEVASEAHEFPIGHDQRIEAQSDGSVIVKGTASCATEAKRWLRVWGSHAVSVELAGE